MYVDLISHIIADFIYYSRIFVESFGLSTYKNMPSGIKTAMIWDIRSTYTNPLHFYILAMNNLKMKWRKQFHLVAYKKIKCAPDGTIAKEPACWCRRHWDGGSIPALGRSPGGGHATASTLAWRIPRTEETSGLQSMGLQRVGHDWSAWALTCTKE